MINKSDILSRLYYHELESRDKIFGRLQLNFAIYASIIALLAYMVRMIDYGSSCVVLTIFFVGLSIAVLPLGWSIYLTIAALTGLKYKTFPRANDLISYADEVDKHADDIQAYNSNYNQDIEVPDPEKKLDKYVCKAYANCIDHNYEINELRRKAIRNSLWGMVIASIPILISSFAFVFYDLDASSPRKVSASFNEGTPLVNAIESINGGISNIPTKNQDKEALVMPNKNSGQKDDEQKQIIPPPPPEPTEPELQVSIENFKEPLPDKAKMLNEDK